MHLETTAATRADAIAREFVVLTCHDLLALDVARPGFILDSVIGRGCLHRLRGASGVGKSWLALSLAHAVATGTALLGWVPRALQHVLYVDTALPLDTLRQRLARIAGPDPVPGRLRIVAADAQPCGRSALATPDGRAVLDRLVAADTDLVVIDGLAGLARGRHGMDEVAEWLVGLRRRGIAVLVIETTRRRHTPLDDVMDVEITVTRPSDPDTDAAPRMVVRLDKMRVPDGRMFRPFEARATPADGRLRWLRREAHEVEARTACLLRDQGLTAGAIARRLGVSRATVYRYLARARELGLAASPRPGAATDTAARPETSATRETGGTRATHETNESRETGETCKTHETGETHETSETSANHESRKTGERCESREAGERCETRETRATAGSDAATADAAPSSRTCRCLLLNLLRNEPVESKPHPEPVEG